MPAHGLNYWLFFAVGAVFGYTGVVLVPLSLACQLARPLPPPTARMWRVVTWIFLVAGTLCASAHVGKWAAAWRGNPYEKYALIRSHADPWVVGPLYHVPTAPYWWAYWWQISATFYPLLLWIPPLRRQPLFVLILTLYTSSSYYCELAAGWVHRLAG